MDPSPDGPVAVLGPLEAAGAAAAAAFAADGAAAAAESVAAAVAAESLADAAAVEEAPAMIDEAASGEMVCVEVDWAETTGEPALPLELRNIWPISWGSVSMKA